MESIFKRLLDLTKAGKIGWDYGYDYPQESSGNYDWDEVLHGGWKADVGRSNLSLWLSNYTGVLGLSLSRSERYYLLLPDKYTKTLLEFLSDTAAINSEHAGVVHEVLDTLEESKE